MVKTCLACGKETPMPGTEVQSGTSHGFCQKVIPGEKSACARAWIAWTKLPKPKPNLRDYYRTSVLKRRSFMSLHRLFAVIGLAFAAVVSALYMFVFE